MRTEYLRWYDIWFDVYELCTVFVDFSLQEFTNLKSAYKDSNKEK